MAHEKLGEVLVAKGQFKKGIEHFNRALAEAPSAELHNKLGVAHDLVGDGERAQHHYRSALALDPNAIRARNNLALSMVVSGSYDDAVQEMEQVAAHPDATAQYRQNLAFVYGIAGQFDAAERVLEKAGQKGADLSINRTTLERVRALAVAGNKAAVFAFLRNPQAGLDPADIKKIQQAKAAAKQKIQKAEKTAKATPVQNKNGASKSNKKMTIKPLKINKNIEKKQSANMAANANSDETVPTVADAAPKASKPAAKATMPRNKPESRIAALIDSLESSSDPTHAAPPAEKSTKPDDASPQYRVQLAAYRTVRHATRGRDILTKLVGSRINGLEVLVKRSRSSGSRSIDVRVRSLPYESRAKAVQACADVRSAGQVGCLVYRHNERLWPPIASLAQKSAETIKSRGLYRIQLAAYRSAKGAAKGRALLTKLIGDYVSELDTLVRRPAIKKRQAFKYRIRTKALENYRQAISLCAKIRAAGHDGCLVIQLVPPMSDRRDKLDAWCTGTMSGFGRQLRR